MARKWLKYISFGGLLVIITLLITATIIEKLKGSSFVLEQIYHSPLLIALFGITAISALSYIVTHTRGFRLFLLHTALATILSGALISHLTAEDGEIILAKDSAPASMFTDSAGELKKLPFRMMLVETTTLYDKQNCPIDYFARIDISDSKESSALTLSMNSPIKKDGYIFCIKSHSQDVISLLVAHDPWGIFITYSGYTIFIVTFLFTLIVHKRISSPLPHKMNGKTDKKPVNRILYIASAILFIAIGTAGCLRWYRTGLFPVTNGYEAMLLISWCGLLTGIIFKRHISLVLPIMFTLSVMALVAAFFTKSNDTGLIMPVLRTPLLGLHVSCVILSYTLIGFLAINALIGIFYKHFRHDENKVLQLADTGRSILYPAILLLFTGIFIGAVWANISWGRYWGWDPKEVWALITLLLCSLPFHAKSIPQLARPIVFHYFCIILFFAMLFTYLGVNYFLGGIHAYL